MMNEFEMRYMAFIDGKDYEKGELEWFALLRSAYTAGWIAAGGEPPVYPEKDIEGTEK